MTEKLFVGRVSEVIAKLGGLTSASEKTGITRSLLAKYRDGSSEPTRPKLIALAEAAEIDLGWLANGDGSSEGRAMHTIRVFSCRLNDGDQIQQIDSTQVPDRLFSIGQQNIGSVSSESLCAFELKVPDSFVEGSRSALCITKKTDGFEDDGPYAVSIARQISFRYVVGHSSGYYLYATRDMAGHADKLSFVDAERLSFCGKIIWSGGAHP